MNQTFIQVASVLAIRKDKRRDPSKNDEDDSDYFLSWILALEFWVD